MSQEFNGCRAITRDDGYVLALVRERATELAQEVTVIQQCAVMTETQRQLLREAAMSMREALLKLDQHAYTNSWGEVIL